MLKAAFFDLDHTLQDLDTPFHAALRSVFGPACEAAGVPVAELEACLARLWPNLWARFLAGSLAPDALGVEWFATALPAAGIPLAGDRVQRLARCYEEAFEGGLRLYPEVLPALTALRLARPDLPLGIVTNGPSARQRKRAAALGLGRWFDIWVISEEVGSAKPDRRIFEVALARARVGPAEAVMVGDDPRTDVAGAQAAGLHGLWVNRGGRPWPAEVGMAPDGAAADLAGVVAMIRDL